MPLHNLASLSREQPTVDTERQDGKRTLARNERPTNLLYLAFTKGLNYHQRVYQRQFILAAKKREEGKEWELVVFYDSSFHFVWDIPWDVRMQSHHYAPLSRNRN